MIADVRHHLSVAALYGRLSAQRALEYPFSLLSISLGLGFNYVWIGVALKVLVDQFSRYRDGLSHSSLSCMG